MSQKYIFQMAALTKKIGQREVLKDIWLAFYPGAKIGVLGRNGSGKSTLLRIMAGKDKNFDGEARLTDGFTVGLLEQEPQLNPDKDVFGNVEEAVAPTRALLTEFEQLSEKLGEVTDPDEMEKLLERQAKVQDKIEAVQRLGARPAGRSRHERDEPAAGRRRRDKRSPAARSAASRCARSCWSGPTCCCSTSRPTISTPKASPGWSGIWKSIRAPSSP